MPSLRQTLKALNTVRATFTGTFVRVGSKSGFKGPLPTVLLAEIRDTQGRIVTDHLWFNLTKGFAALHLHEGDQVMFDARVRSYEKGYKGHRTDCPIRTDYHLSYPTRLRKVDECL